MPNPFFEESFEDIFFGKPQSYEPPPYRGEISLYEPDENLTRYDDFINRALANNQSTVDKNLIYRMMKQESSGNPNAYSSAGAQGLFQLMPETAESLGVTDRSDPEQNINGAVKLITQLMQKYNGDQKKVLAAYNGGESGVDKATKAYGDAWLENLHKFKGVNPKTGRNHAEETWAYIDAIEKDVPSGPPRDPMKEIEAILGFEPEQQELPVQPQQSRSEYVSRETSLQPQEATEKPGDVFPQEVPEQKVQGIAGKDYKGLSKEEKKQLAQSLIDSGNDDLLMKVLRLPEHAIEGFKALARTPIQLAKGFVKLGKESVTPGTEKYDEELAKLKEAGIDSKRTRFLEKYVKERDERSILDEKIINTANRIVESKVLKEEALPRSEGVMGYIEDVVRMAPQVAAQIGVTAVTGGAAGTLFMGAQIAGGKYEKLEKEGVDTKRNVIASLVDATLQAPLEQIGISKALKLWQPGKVGLQALKEIGGAGLTEFVTENLQKYPEVITEIWAKTEGKPLNERTEMFVDNWWKMTKEGLREGSIAALMSGVTSGVGVTLQSGNESLTITPEEVKADPEAAHKKVSDWSLTKNGIIKIKTGEGKPDVEVLAGGEERIQKMVEAGRKELGVESPEAKKLREEINLARQAAEKLPEVTPSEEPAQMIKPKELVPPEGIELTRPETIKAEAAKEELAKLPEPEAAKSQETKTPLQSAIDEFEGKVERLEGWGTDPGKQPKIKAEITRLSNKYGINRAELEKNVLWKAEPPKPEAEPKPLTKEGFDVKQVEIKPTEKKPDELGVKSEEVSKSVDEYLDDFAPSMGFSIRDESKTKKVDDNVKMPEGFDKDFEGAYQKAHGLERPSIAERVKGAVTKIKNAFTRHNPLLDPGKYAAENEILRQQDVVNEVSQVEAANITRGITAGLGPKMYNAFEHNVILPDLMKDIEGGLYEGKKLPLNLRDAEHAKTVHDQWQKVAELNPAIKQAVEKRTGFMRAIKKEMVDNNLLPAKVLEDDRYFHHQVLEYMAINESVSGGKGLRGRRHGYQRSRIGAANAYNTDYIQSEYEVLSKMLAQLRTKKNIERLMNVSDISEKIIAEAKEKGVKPETLIPEGYETWQPEKGNVFYQTNSISDKVVNDVLVEGKVLTEEDISKVRAIGGKKKEYIIPTELKKTLESYSKLKDDNVLGKYSKGAMDAWKQWTLLNPQRVVKYQVNNLSGDLDITFAYKPSIVFKEAWKAAKDLAPSGLAGKAPSREIMKAMEKGVLGSGFSGKEIGEISENEFFKHITGKDPNIIEKYWGGVKKFTTYRENILRLAAYRHFQKEIAAGKRPVGVSKKKVMEGLYKSIDEGKMESDDAAARLARDLIGDYGNISQAGQFLRSHVMPFYSWMEINAPRYIRLVQNLPAEERGAVAGRLAGVAAKKGAAFAGKTAIRGGALAAKAAGLSVLINLWNHTFFPDEEKEMGRARRELHLITGRDKETGEIRSVRFQGALADLLDWVGAADIHHDIGDVVSGKATVGDKVKEAGKSALSKIVNSLGPQFKLPVELATKKTLYPDFSRPRPIRDRGEYVAKTFSVDLPYRVFSGKPLRGIKDELMASIVYKTDPGEQAYFDSKSIIGDFMRKKGSDVSTFEPSNRSNALYYYKKAISYGDDRAADRWLKRYKEIGGTDKGVIRSIRYASPDFGVNKKYREEFYSNLTPEEKETFETAKKWYNKIYYKK